MYMRHWLQSPSSLTHGNIIKREIFSKSNGDATDNEGAILRYVDSFSRCYLEPKISSVPTALDDRQLIFYIVDGSGVFEAGDLKQQVGEGDAILVPPRLNHVLNNLEDAPIRIFDIGRDNPGRRRSIHARMHSSETIVNAPWGKDIGHILYIRFSVRTTAW